MEMSDDEDGCDEYIERLAEDGYVVVKGVAPPETAERLLRDGVAPALRLAGLSLDGPWPPEDGRMIQGLSGENNRIFCFFSDFLNFFFLGERSRSRC